MVKMMMMMIIIIIVIIIVSKTVKSKKKMTNELNSNSQKKCNDWDKNVLGQHGVEQLCFNQSLSGIDSQKQDKVYINTTSNKRDKPFSAYFPLSNMLSVQFTLKMRLILKHCKSKYCQ